MVAVEDAVDERLVDGPPVLGLEFGEPLRAFGKRGAAFAGPHESVERKPLHPAGMLLGEGGSPERTRRDAVHQQRTALRALQDVGGRRGEVIGAVGDVEVDVALLVRAPVAFHVNAPRVVVARGEPFHHGAVRPAGNLQIEGRLRGHRRAVHEQDGACGRLLCGRALLPEEKPHIPLRGPVLLSLDGVGHACFLTSCFLSRRRRRYRTPSRASCRV